MEPLSVGSNMLNWFRPIRVEWRLAQTRNTQIRIVLRIVCLRQPPFHANWAEPVEHVPPVNWNALIDLSVYWNILVSQMVLMRSPSEARHKPTCRLLTILIVVVVDIHDGGGSQMVGYPAPAHPTALPLCL